MSDVDCVRCETENEDGCVDVVVDGEYDMVHQFEEMEEHDIKNVRYDAAEFEPVVED